MNIAGSLKPDKKLQANLDRMVRPNGCKSLMPNGYRGA